MNWKTIRLELGPTAGFPKGSASRAFVLCAPLDERCFIDREAVAGDPRCVTVRRFWASEADEFGQLEYDHGCWTWRRDGEEGDAAYRFVAGPFAPDATVHVEEADGTRLPFRVANGELSIFGIAAQ